MTDRQQNEVAELRKPVACELKEIIEWHSLYKADVAKYNELSASDSRRAVSQIEGLLQNAARDASARDALMGDISDLRERLDYASGVVTSQEGKILRLEERERQLRDALPSLVDITWNEATESEQVPSTDWARRIIQKWEAALAASPAPVEKENELYRLLVVRGYSQEEADRIANGPGLYAPVESERERQLLDLLQIVAQRLRDDCTVFGCEPTSLHRIALYYAETQRIAAALAQAQREHQKPAISAADHEGKPVQLCSDCPPAGYATDKTRCASCPIKQQLKPLSPLIDQGQFAAASAAGNEVFGEGGTFGGTQE